MKNKLGHALNGAGQFGFEIGCLLLMNDSLDGQLVENTGGLDQFGRCGFLILSGTHFFNGGFQL